VKPWYVKNTAFSERISADDKSTFRRICPDKTFAKGSAVFRAGDAATSLHVIAKGQVKLVTSTASGNERILAICGPDDFIGEAFLQQESHYRVDAVALTDVMTCPMSREQFMRLALNAPTFVLSFAEILAGNLFQCREQLSNAYDPVRVRMVKVLLEQTQRFGRPLGEAGWFELVTELKHEDIAALISATRVSVSMALAELRDEGFVVGTRGHYRLNVPALTSSVEGLAV